MRAFLTIPASLVAALLWVAPLHAQDESLADIRQELSVLYVEVQRLKLELSTTGAVSTLSGGNTALERIDLIEAELSRLTALTERVQNRVARVVQDGTNRIGDLEFRLVELEGGDISALGETTTLGGDFDNSLTAAVTTPANTASGSELAVSEQADFDQAMSAYEEGSFQDAAVKFTVFTEAYPIGPLTGEAHFFRGEALTALGDTSNAARAYLESFSGAPDNIRAPQALLQLGLSLADLGQQNEACIALGQVPVRYPEAAAASDAAEAAASMNCL